jgi:ElaB/YqjD/DUF883 family membrane-anchored ribosome-binding protein
LIARSNSNIGSHGERTVTSNADKLEDRTAEILGQIQASVAEYVRTMNEAGALRRREADEVHRQQDEAIRALKAIQIQATQTAEAHSRLAAKAGSDWLGLVERGFQGIAVAQAEAAVRASVVQLDVRLNELTEVVRDAVGKVGQLADRNERICRSLAWKTVVTTAGWLLVVSIGFRIFSL